jgi:hypothetical protein
MAECWSIGSEVSTRCDRDSGQRSNPLVFAQGVELGPHTPVGSRRLTGRAACRWMAEVNRPGPLSSPAAAVTRCRAASKDIGAVPGLTCRDS